MAAAFPGLVLTTVASRTMLNVNCVQHRLILKCFVIYVLYTQMYIIIVYYYI